MLSYTQLADLIYPELPHTPEEYEAVDKKKRELLLRKLAQRGKSIDELLVSLGK